MATRRSMGIGGERDYSMEDDQGDGFDLGSLGSFQSPDSGGGLMGGPDQNGVFPPGQSPAEMIGAVRESPSIDNAPGAAPPERSIDEGNTDRGRDLAVPSATPNTFGLPQGVSVNDSMSVQSPGVGVNEGMFQGVPNYANSMDTPQASRTPELASGSISNAIPEGGTNSGPTRRSASSPSIYGESRNPTMFGRADGLLGGGKGLVGAAETSGPLSPTDMMQKLVQLFRMRGDA